MAVVVVVDMEVVVIVEEVRIFHGRGGRRSGQGGGGVSGIKSNGWY